MYRKRKNIRKKINQIFKLPNLFGNRLIWGELSNSCILNDIGRNSLLGNRRKIAKFLMSTFTYRSTFLYDLTPLRIPLMNPPIRKLYGSPSTYIFYLFILFLHKTFMFAANYRIGFLLNGYSTSQ